MPVEMDLETVRALGAFVDQLGTNPAIEILQCDFGPPPNDGLLALAESKLSPDLLGVYAAADGITIRWQYRGDPRTFQRGNGGSFRLPTLPDNLQGFGRAIGFEAVGAAPVCLLDRTSLDHGFSHHGVAICGDGVYIFDGCYASPTGVEMPALIQAGIAMGFVPRWMDRVAGTDRGGHVRLSVSQARLALGARVA